MGFWPVGHTFGTNTSARPNPHAHFQHTPPADTHPTCNTPRRRFGSRPNKTSHAAFLVLCPIGHNKHRLCLEFRRVSWRV